MSTTVRLPAPVNAHSHAFHRLLRGRTHHGGGDFWVWRERMYEAARLLTPETYQQLATAVYAEMATAGFSAVGEFHYLHHRDDGRAYPDHEMERALARAALTAGVRLVLLDTCYLSGGLDQYGRTIPLNAVQRRFSDGSADQWLERWEGLRIAIAEEDDGAGLVTLGAAVHSLRAVPEPELAAVRRWVKQHPELAVHVHLSEQPAENSAVRAAYGLSPTQLLDRAEVLTSQLSAVHATHLSDADIELLGQARASIVMCPTTEADLADGIGPARRLADAGATIALGTDQHAVVDPFLEMRALEHGERLGSGARGRFSPAELLEAARAGSLRSLALPDNDDYIEVRTDSVRTAGSRADQLPLSATAGDVGTVVVGGRRIARDGVHATLGDPAELFTQFFAEHPEYA